MKHTDPSTTRIAEDFVTQVRNKLVADIYHHLKGEKVTGTTLGQLFGMTRQRISNLEKQYYGENCKKTL